MFESLTKSSIDIISWKREGEQNDSAKHAGGGRRGWVCVCLGGGQRLGRYGSSDKNS